MPGREFRAGVCGRSPACPAGAEPLSICGFGSTDCVLSSEETFTALEYVWSVSQTVGTWLAVQKSEIPAPEQVSFSLGAVALLAASTTALPQLCAWLDLQVSSAGAAEAQPAQEMLSLLVCSWLPGGRICSSHPAGCSHTEPSLESLHLGAFCYLCVDEEEMFLGLSAFSCYSS